ncbi:MAG: hypothetical protein WBJ10_16895 [Daejeonella sp.]|uniref:hypothetical protein n=1 Tax=Daejeonella sp. TaxID=2805397 RepID=UPI003C78EF81
MENNKNSNFAFAILAGVAAGAATYYLMNNENGKQHWLTLLNTVKDLSEKFLESEQGSRMASAGRDASEYISQKANGILEESKKYS